MKLSVAITKYGDMELPSSAESIMKGWTTLPKPKKIDMSVCIESQIDCEFSDLPLGDSTYISKLKKLIPELRLGYIDTKQDRRWRNCRPRFNHIHAKPKGWDKCPVPEGFILKIWNKQMDDRPSTSGSQITCWENVTMFQVTGLQEEWEL